MQHTKGRKQISTIKAKEKRLVSKRKERRKINIEIMVITHNDALYFNVDSSGSSTSSTSSDCEATTLDNKI